MSTLLTTAEVAQRLRAAGIPEGDCQCGCGGKTPIATRSDARWGAVKGKPRQFMPTHHPRPARCPVGHPLEGDNVYITSQGWRQCRACRRLHGREAARRRRARTPEVVRAESRKGVAAWAKRNPEKCRAQRLLRRAVRAGRVVRAEACEACGGTGTLHGHHDDYDRPLDVRWLCPLCHKAAHRGEL